MSATPSQTVGPFFAIGLTRREEHCLVDDGVELTGILLDGQEEPMPDGVLEIVDPASGAWGRAGTDSEGRFRFRIPSEATRLEAHVFARGLLRHQLTRIYLDGGASAEDQTLVAETEGEGFRHNIRMQGERATLFFSH